MITEIKPRADDGRVITIAIHRAKLATRSKILQGAPAAVLRAQRNEACGALLCENCAQDPADDETRWCPDHWLIRTLEHAA